MKTRCEPLELVLLRSLTNRMTLSPKEKSHYLNLEKGYQGELVFDDWIKSLSNDRLILHDLLLEFNTNVFQIDSLCIGSKAIYLFEVKNYLGDFFIESEKWYSLPKLEIKNPLHQLKRNETLLRQLLNELGFHPTIESFLVFINPEFHLYQAPPNSPMLFPAQLNRFLKKEKKKPSLIISTHFKMAELLLSLHLKNSPYNRFPTYDYNQLKKGIICPNCQAFYKQKSHIYFICGSCGFKEDYSKAFLRAVEEFKLLFPNRKLTTTLLLDWCKIIKAEKTVRKFLTSHFKKVGHGKASHYE